MQVHITARHLDLTPALADYIQKKLDRVQRHFPEVLRAQVVLSVEKHRHLAEVVIHAQGHHDFRTFAESGDLYAAIDLVAEKLHKHMARQKDKRVRGRRRPKKNAEPAEAVVPLFASEGASAEDTVPVTRVTSFIPKTMTLKEAAAELRNKKYEFLLFYSDNTLNVLYKRKDDSYGLLEPEIS